MSLPALSFPEPNPVLEAGDGPAKRVQRANRAGLETLGDRTRLERDATKQVLTRLQTLQAALRQRLIVGDGSLTDFKRATLSQLLADTDRLIVDATADLADIANRQYQQASDLGQAHATEPIHAAQLTILQATPGLDAALVQAAFGNTVDLLTLPMQQFATDVKVSLRRVALAGDNRFEELQRLRDKISGAGFDQAQFKAERIIRTELGRVFNESTFGRLQALARDFPFLNKGWRATKDNRTRLGHQEAAATYARGQGIPIADLFAVKVYDERKGKAVKLIGTATLRFPLDPNAAPSGRLAAGATIMCRCNAFVDFNMEQFAAFTQARVSLAMGGPKPPTPARPAPKLPTPKAPKMVKQTVKAPKVPTPTLAKLRAK